MAAHSSIPAWKIPWTEEPGRLQSTGSQSWTPLSVGARMQQVQGEYRRAHPLPGPSLWELWLGPQPTPRAPRIPGHAFHPHAHASSPSRSLVGPATLSPPTPQ